DFTLLDNQSGFLYRVVNTYSKRTLHDVYFKDLEIKVSQLKEKLDKAQEELQTSSLNLRAEILRRYLPEHIEANTVFYISHNKHGQIGSSWSFVELCENESLFCDFLSRELPSGIAISHARNGYHYQDAFPISRDKRSESLREYNKRSPVILDKNQKTIEQLSKNILNTQRVLYQRNGISLHD
ncbi:hypothetical protein, partial [Citrobacter sp. FR21RM1OL9030]|uniref:hypothetical protein n=1 Tax=Citrobacter sp. FR21RM1OL9030 TaxID=3381297 RepID=UPI003A96FB63